MIPVKLILIAAVTAAAIAAQPALARTEAADYYVSLGDSFAVGVQPVGETDQGYPDQLLSLLKPEHPRLRLVKLGCGGESTRSMRFGSVDPSEGFSCGPPDFYLHRYPHKTQLAVAVAFLHAHRRHVSLVTIDIGGNDVLGGGGVPQLQANLPAILAALRTAAGPAVPIVGMTYYDPFLVDWFDNPSGLQGHIEELVAFNDVLEGDYTAADDPVADVGDAFSSTDATVQPDGVPLDVDRICSWTWMCVAGDLHPNATGYGVIAQAFDDALTSVRQSQRRQP